MEESDRLTRLVNDILDLSKLQAGSAQLSPVSYTHLDVYKRQALGRVKAGGQIKMEQPL